MTTRFFFSCVDNRYQSLRRQLNAYGFRKHLVGDYKSYWTHPTFSRGCSVDVLKAITGPFRGGNGSKSKEISTRSRLPKLPNKVEVMKVKRDKADKSIDALPCGVQSSSNRTTLTKAQTLKFPQTKVPMNQGQSFTSQSKAFYNTKVFAGRRRSSELCVKTAEGKLHECPASKSEMGHLPIDEPFLSSPIPDFSHAMPPFYDTSSDDALTALATVASFLPVAPTALYTPIVKCVDTTNVTKPVPIKENEPPVYTTSPQAIKMTIHAGAANIFLPTPIKVPIVADVDQGFWSDNIDCCMDDCTSTYSMGSLSSPMRLMLPSGNRSAFTPVFSTIDQMVAEFCSSFD
jgi:hypothetical protein